MKLAFLVGGAVLEVLLVVSSELSPLRREPHHGARVEEPPPRPRRERGDTGLRRRRHDRAIRS